MVAYRKLVRYSTVGAGAAAITLVFSQTKYPQDVLGNSNVGRILNAPLEASLTACQGVVRSSRAVYTFTVNTLDYKYSLRGYDHKSEDYYRVRSQVHLRAAKRILKLCESNKGFYLKAGQFVASMQHVPKEYTSTLSTLQDQAIPYQIEAIKHVFVDNFGKDLSEIFVTFDEQPIAAASIAQVHHATLADGQEVAVKVGHCFKQIGGKTKEEDGGMRPWSNEKPNFKTYHLYYANKLVENTSNFKHYRC
ncbi:uncharacterized protein LOC131857287 isoform X1 [Cryptomeria japonica]|uniref:uncharacterized protein LOC131857287 isoform X1 n=1 Tax=Cryptomeria japonica TaxID=3369 RepID=UPI0027D9EEBB|nr:uncharacterized protein LOC131857287 isoform X1 [Cryptomeria japonica]